MIDPIDLSLLVTRILPFLTSIIAVYIADSIFKKLNAEKQLYLVIKSKLEQRSKSSYEFIEIQNTVRSRHNLRNKSLDLDTLDNARKTIFQLLKEMNESDRLLIMQALNQPSERGRANYAKKLLDNIYYINLNEYIKTLAEQIELGNRSNQEYALESINDLNSYQHELLIKKQSDIEKIIRRARQISADLEPDMESKQVIDPQEFADYLHKQFPGRVHAEIWYLSELIRDLIKEGYTHINEIDELLAKYPLEKYIPQIERETEVEMSDVGIIRSLLVARRIDEINRVIMSWRPLPSEPRELQDLEPFVNVQGMKSYLMRSDADIKIHTTNAGDLDITYEELGNRIGTGLPYLRRLSSRLDSFHTYLLSRANINGQG